MPSLLVERLRLALGTAGGDALAGDADVDGQPLDPQPARVAAAVLVPVVLRDEPQLLLTTRTAHLRAHGGQVAFPGGRIDASDRTPVAAALREAHEEVGLDPARVEILGVADSWLTGTGYDVRPVVGALPADIALRPNPAEVADLFEVPLAHALDPANHELAETEWQGRMRRYYRIRWQDRLIWGATAGILVALARRVGA